MNTQREGIIVLMKLRISILSLYIFFTCITFLHAESLPKYPSLNMMLGEMILVGFEGHTLRDDAPILQILRDNKAGGVILFEREAYTRKSRNIRSPEQTKALITQLQQAASQKIFISVDQEGGAVQRLSKRTGFQNWPSAKELGKLSTIEIYNSALSMGKVMAGLGFNLNFAPVVDLNDPQSTGIGHRNRAFNVNPAEVIVSAGAFAQGLHDAGIMPVLKHFPGHGTTPFDTHYSSADASSTWTDEELLPYRAFIDNAFQGMIMTAHISISQFGDAPATLSPRIINTLLREELGWDGVVITDDISMKAIAQNYSLEDTVYLAIQAGVDIILVSNNPWQATHTAQSVHAILLSLVKEGQISEERIRTSWRRIDALKRSLLGSAVMGQLTL